MWIFCIDAVAARVLYTVHYTEVYKIRLHLYRLKRGIFCNNHRNCIHYKFIESFLHAPLLFSRLFAFGVYFTSTTLLWQKPYESVNLMIIIS